MEQDWSIMNNAKRTSALLKDVELIDWQCLCICLANNKEIDFFAAL